MKVQVTKNQFIETDSIDFAESALWSDKVTLVYLKHRDKPVQVDTDYDMFVDRINRAVVSKFHPQHIHTS